MRPTYPLSFAALVAAAAGTASALPRPILIGDNGAVGVTGSAVPGVAGATFDRFDRPRNSLSGQYYALLARSNDAAATEAVYLRGTGPTVELLVQEGVTPVDGARVAENVSDRWLGVNDAGQVALGLNLTGATTDDETAVIATPGSLAVAYRRGQPISSQPSLAYGATIEVNGLTNIGGIAARLDSITGTGVTTSNDEAAVLNSGATIVVRQGVTAPTGGPTISDIDIGGVSVGAAGGRYLVSGVLGTGAAARDVVIVDGTAAVVQGQPLPGSPADTAVELFSAGSKMEPNGDWYARVRLNTAGTGPGAIVRNGSVLARTGDAVPGGLVGELFADVSGGVDTFFANASDGLGNTVYAGFTNNPDATQQAVWVYNDSTVLLREGDRVDLNGNGLPDDDAFVDVRNLTSASLGGEFEGYVLTPAAMYGVFNLVDGAGTYLGQTFMSVPVPEPTAAAALAAAGVVAALRRRGRVAVG